MPKKSHVLLVVALCGLFASAVGLCINSVGVFYTPMSEGLRSMRGDVALHTTISNAISALVSLFAVRVHRHLGFKKVLATATAIAVVPTIAMAGSSSVAELYVLGALRGVGTGFFGMVVITVMVNNWFYERRGAVTGLIFGVGGVAGALFSPLLSLLIEICGWRFTTAFMGCALFVLNLPALVCRIEIEPGAVGCTPYGIACTETKREGFLLKTRVPAVVATLTLISLLHSCLTGIPQHFIGYAETLQLGTATGSLMVSGALLSDIVFKLSAGSISDHTGPFATIAALVALNTASIVMLMAFQSSVALIISAALFGSVYSVTGVCLSTLAQRILSRSDYEKWFPVVSSACILGSAVSLSVVGYLYDLTGTYATAFFAALGIHLADLILLVLIWLISSAADNDRCRIAQLPDSARRGAL